MTKYAKLTNVNWPAENEYFLLSASPRRANLLQLIGLPIVQKAFAIEEKKSPDETYLEYVLRNAQEKEAHNFEMLEQQGSYPFSRSDIVSISADTVVVMGDKVLEKPGNVTEGKQMLGMLSGSWHTVCTGVCIKLRRRENSKGSFSVVGSNSFYQETAVKFRNLSGNEIEGYLNLQEPWDKAGSYGIQGMGSVFVEEIKGCYFNVMGLPVQEVFQALRDLGIAPVGW